MKLRRLVSTAMLLFPALLLGQTTAPAAKKEPTASGRSCPVMSAAAKGRARQLFGYMESGQSAPLFAAFSAKMKKGASAAQVATMARQSTNQMGHEEKMLGENFAPDLLAANTVYSRYSRFAKSKEPVFTLITVDEQGQITRLQSAAVPPLPANRYSDYKDTARLTLPFNGEWFVYEGGREIYQNVNAYRDAERYALIFTVLKDGRPFAGDGSTNDQYYCYGQPVVAPADGTVVLVNDSFGDNSPGHPGDAMPTGNRVLIHHGHQEYSLFMHLKQNSIKVKSGAKVKQGDVVGECGNSGNSPAPHLEYRLQNSKGVPFPQTLPAQFVDYLADGAAVASGEPVRGQTVRNSPSPAAPAGEKP